MVIPLSRSAFSLSRTQAYLKDPCGKKRALTYSLKFIYRTYISRFLRLLLEPLNGSLVDTSAVVDQVTSGGELARVDMADNNNVNVGLFFPIFVQVTIMK